MTAKDLNRNIYCRISFLGTFGVCLCFCDFVAVMRFGFRNTWLLAAFGGAFGFCGPPALLQCMPVPARCVVHV